MCVQLSMMPSCIPAQDQASQEPVYNKSLEAVLKLGNARPVVLIISIKMKHLFNAEVQVLQSHSVGMSNKECLSGDPTDDTDPLCKSDFSG